MCYEVPIVQSRNDILSWNFSVIIRECYPHFSLSFSDNNEYIEFNYEELLSNNNYAKKTKPYNIEICAGWQDNTLFSFLTLYHFSELCPWESRVYHSSSGYYSPFQIFPPHFYLWFPYVLDFKRTAVFLLMYFTIDESYIINTFFSHNKTNSMKVYLLLNTTLTL